MNDKTHDLEFAIGRATLPVCCCEVAWLVSVVGVRISSELASPA